MGNQLAAPARVQPGELLATDVPNLVFKDSLGGGRFLKTFLTRHEEGQRGGLVVVKVYLKRGAPGTGGGLDPALVKEHERRLRRLRNALSSPAPTHLHAWPFQRELETDRAVYLMRQYAHSTLYDRVSTRPFLSHVEKKWMAYQLLHGLADCHERGIAHGDVKLENVLVTSWGWAFLTDFATFKPETLPADNPADYSFFFDTGGRRRCYVAPERFRDGAQGSPGDPRGAEASAASAAGPGGSAGAPTRRRVPRGTDPAPTCDTAFSRRRTRTISPPRTCSAWGALWASCSWTARRSSTCRSCWRTGAASTTRVSSCRRWLTATRARS